MKNTFLSKITIATFSVLAVVLSFTGTVSAFDTEGTMSANTAPKFYCPPNLTCTPKTQVSGSSAGVWKNTAVYSTVAAPVIYPVSNSRNEKCYTFSKDLKFRNGGKKDRDNTPDVIALQTWLMGNGYDITALSRSGRITDRGYFGSATVAALMNYQEDQNIEPTGYFGPETRQKINDSCVGTKTESALISYITPISGNSGTQVTIFGSGFQKGNYVKVTGKAFEQNIIPSQSSKTQIVFNMPTLDAPNSTYDIQVGYGDLLSSRAQFTNGAVQSVGSASVTVNGQPTLALTYDGAQKEASLTATFNVTVNGGTSGVNIYRQGGGAQFVNQIGSSINANSITAGTLTPRTFPAVNTGTDGYGQTYYIIPANQAVEFQDVVTVNPKQLFAGTYYASLKTIWANQGTDLQKSFNMDVSINQTNNKTIIGEVSPYIMSVKVVSGGLIVISGQRLNNANIYIDGTLRDPVRVVRATDGTEISFRSPFTTDGQHNLYLNDPKTGQSNTFGFQVGSGNDQPWLNITSPSANPSITIKPMTALNVVWDSNYESRTVTVSIYDSLGKHFYDGNYPSRLGKNVQSLPPEATNLSNGSYGVAVADKNSLDSSGHPVSSGVLFNISNSIVIQPSLTPVVNYITPSFGTAGTDGENGDPGTVITIYGSNFLELYSLPIFIPNNGGPTQNMSPWSIASDGHSMKVPVPHYLPVGSYTVKVTNLGSASASTATSVNGASFTVTSGTQVSNNTISCRADYLCNTHGRTTCLVGQTWNGLLCLSPQDQTLKFSKNFSLNQVPTSLSLSITADNAYSVNINGRSVGMGNDYNYIDTYNIAPYVNQGNNTITITVVNEADSNTGNVTWATNPAGLIYKITGNGSTIASSDSSDQVSGHAAVSLSSTQVDHMWPSISGVSWIWDPTYVTRTNNNQSPVITGLNAPITLTAGQQGTWSVSAYDPSGYSLGYTVDWEDSYSCPPGNTCATRAALMTPIVQTSTFTHTYANSGSYTPRFTVRNSAGLTAETSATVQVGGVITPSNVDLVINNVVKADFHQYGFKMDICVNGSKSINDLKMEIPSLRYFPANISVFDSNGSEYKTDASGSGSIEYLKNGQCFNNFGVTLQSNQYAAYDQTKKATFRLDPDNIIPEINESNNTVVFSGPITPPTITVISPNGGEAPWQIGQQVKIRWQTVAMDTNVPTQLTIFDDRITDWQAASLFGSSPVLNYASLLSSTNGVNVYEYNFTVPQNFNGNLPQQYQNIFGGNHYKIDVNALIGGIAGTASQQIKTDQSDSPFTIATSSSSGAGGGGGGGGVSSTPVTYRPSQNTNDLSASIWNAVNEWKNSQR